MQDEFVDHPNGDRIKVQAILPVIEGAIEIYHIHGKRQYYGDIKFHKDPCCRHLVAWVPAKGFAKVLMKEWWRAKDVLSKYQCLTCFKV